MPRGPLQPHSGAIILVLYHSLKHPEFRFFDVRMKEVSDKVYRAELSGRSRDELVFRVGKSWPCYSTVFVSSSLLANAGQDKPLQGAFRIRHNHTSVQEEFHLADRKIYLGRLRSEKGIPVNFTGEFMDDKNLWLIEEYPSEMGGTVFFRRDYEIERAW